MRKWVSTACGLLLFFFASAQQFGGNPPSVKWKQLNTDTARVIFPAGMDSVANRVASIVHYLAAAKPLSLGDRLKKINIVLQNQTTIANGYVNLGPYRSEFFLTPDLNSLSQGSVGWADQLAVHEYRHVQQFNNFNNGLSHFMKVISGEDGYSLAINASIPDWFYEGDAVYQETALTSQGRGRLPHFMNAYPALWQAGKNYSWMKLRNGSLKDYVPNHYYLGYLLVKYGREKYGDGFWPKVTRDASAFRGLFYPFQAAVKKYAGIPYREFIKNAFDDYKKQSGLAARADSNFLFPVNRRVVTGYYFPYAAGQDSLIYLKASYSRRPAFYLKDAGGEHLLKWRDISADEQFSYRNGRIVYAAYETDPRWGWRDYSVIKILDITTGQVKTLTRRSKYFTPDISPGGSRVAAVQADPAGNSALHILDAGTGVLISAIHSRDILLFSDPKFIDEERLVAAVRLRDGKMALALAEVSTGNTTRLSPPSFNVLGFPCVDSDIIYFTASYGGNDDIFALRLDNRKLFRLTRGSTGNYYVNVAGGLLTRSVFTAGGLQLKQTALKDLLWEETGTAEQETLAAKFPLAENNTEGNILDGRVENRNFTAKEYKKGTGLFNFHSWRPYYSDPVFTYSLYGENVLNTLQTEIYYLYNRDEKTSAAGFNAIYGAAFPYLSLGSEYTFGRETEIGTKTRHWDQLDSRVGLILPLRSASGQTFKNFSAGSYYVLRNEFNKGFYKDSIGNSSFSYLLHTLSWSQQTPRAARQVYPRFGYSLLANHRHAISRYHGYQFIANGTLNIPGILPTHNIMLGGSFQQRDTLGQVVFSDRFAYSRGYTGKYFSRMWRFSANYHAPLFYPDWGFGNILYLQSVRINAFYDFTKIYSKDKKQTRDQRSAGAEIFVDTKWWNQYPLSFGFRVSRLLDPDQFDGFKGTVFEFVLPVSILPR